MIISANTLFHFTRDYDTLLSILKSRFLPRLCLEQCLLVKKKWAIPMVCFCDIPLSSIAEHTIKYGGYAIGIKKSWAINKDVNPVLYVPEKSRFVSFGMGALKSARNLNQDSESETISGITKQLLSMFFLMKPYEGEQEVNESVQRIRFYDEREWRYVPPIIKGKKPWLWEDEFNNESKRDAFNTAINNKGYGVPFNPDVINYIIVNSEDEILPLMRAITEIKGGFSYESVELLKTKILSMDRIRQDF